MQVHRSQMQQPITDSKDLYAMQPTGTMGTDTHIHIGISPCFSCCSTWKTSMSQPLIKGTRIRLHCMWFLVPCKSALTLRTAAAPPNRNRMSLRLTCVKQYSNADKEHHWHRRQQYIDSGSSSSDSGKDSGKGISLSTVVSGGDSGNGNAINLSTAVFRQSVKGLSSTFLYKTAARQCSATCLLLDGGQHVSKK